MAKITKALEPNREHYEYQCFMCSFTVNELGSLWFHWKSTHGLEKDLIYDLWQNLK